MSLVVATGPFCATERATSLLQAIKATHYDVVEFPAEKNKIEQHLKADASNVVLFLYADMADVVSSVVQAGNQLPSNELISGWQEGLLNIKKILRAHSTQSILLECSAAEQYPSAFLQQYNTLTHSNLSDGAFSGLPKERDHLSHLLAEAWSKQYPGLLHTQQQLAALAIPLVDTDNVTTISIEAALLQVQALTGAQQLATIQNELQGSLDENKRLANELEQTRQQLQQATTAEKEHQEEAELILAELHRVQEELERLHQQQDASQQNERELKKQAEEQLTAAAKAQQQAEQQQTIATKAQQQAEAADNALKASKEEAELILAELHRVQEELEQLYLQQQSSESVARSAKTTSVKKPLLPHSKKKKGFLSKRREKRNLEKKAKKLVESGFFKPEWYLNTYPDVAANAKEAKNPALHYLQYGGFEGRNPGPDFESSYYLGVYPDVAESGINPLWHYIRMGLQEGRRTKA